VAAVAKGLIGSSLADTKVQGFRFAGVILERGEPAALMLAVAKGLVLAFATGTPVIGFALLHSNGERGVASADWIGHSVLPGQSNSCEQCSRWHMDCHALNGTQRLSGAICQPGLPA